MPPSLFLYRFLFLNDSQITNALETAELQNTRNLKIRNARLQKVHISGQAECRVFVPKGENVLYLLNQNTFLKDLDRSYIQRMLGFPPHFLLCHLL